MKTNASLMRVALALGPITGMAGVAISTEGEEVTADEFARRKEQRQRERENAAARAAAIAAPHIAKAEAKRRRKALKLAALTSEPSA